MNAVVLATATVATWEETELSFEVPVESENPYVDVAFSVTFVHENGQALRRPAFWDGGRTWRVRFAAPREGQWRWTIDAAPHESLEGVGGTVECDGSSASNGSVFRRHGFWRMSEGQRSLIHADGTPAILVGDTAWGLPWRATEEQAQAYATDRAAKGFNAALLMSVQPDMGATGPRDRELDEGFGVGFEDLAQGRLTKLDPDYFQTLDRLVAALTDEGIAAVLQPVFQGFGWKGLGVAGTVVPPEDYARYCRYLVARYGARPVIYLVGADGTGEAPQVEAGGQEVQTWDCYEQPAGLHYQPHARNAAHQDADWVDFQWCQTGHGGEHVPERVADMIRNQPVRAVANGEPSYERTGGPGCAEGWWQGHEAWSNLFAGGTMGVVYGAASLWQWRLHRDEPGHASYFLDPESGWREALDFPGSAYVGLVGKILQDLPTTDMTPNWTLAICPKVLQAPSGLVLAYQENGGDLRVYSDQVPLDYQVVDPTTGQILRSGTRATSSDPVPDPGGAPRLYICTPTAAR